MVNIVSIVNNLDGTYTVTFDSPITNLNPGVDTPDPNFIFFSTGQNDWFQAVFNAAEIVNVIVITCTNGYTDCTLAVLLDQPVDLSAGSSFATTIPVINAT